jgi:hypothetical protein
LHRCLDHGAHVATVISDERSRRTKGHTMKSCGHWREMTTSDQD